MSPNGDDEGWRWRQFRNATHPSFWVVTSHPDMARFIGGRPGFPYQKDDGHPTRAGSGLGFRLRTIFDIIDMPWDWPAEVNYHEASAFLRWKAATEGAANPALAGVTYRMPTEAEYHALRADPSPWPEATVGKSRQGAVAGDGATQRVRLTSSSPAGRDADVSGYGGKVALLDGYDTELDSRVGRIAGGVAVSTRKEGKGGEAGGGEAATFTAASGGAGSAGNADVGVDEYGRYDVIMQPTAPGNLNWRWHSSTPVNMYGPSDAGFYDTHGNGEPLSVSALPWMPFGFPIDLPPFRLSP